MELPRDKSNDHRMSRIVIGCSFSMDISTIFESGTRDFITDELITHENFDDEDVYYIHDSGYTRESSLMAMGVRWVKVNDLSDIIKEHDLVYDSVSRRKNDLDNK